VTRASIEPNQLPVEFIEVQRASEFGRGSQYSDVGPWASKNTGVGIDIWD
jgi:hypothetical protein